MPLLSDPPYHERDVRNLPDCTPEKYTRALELVEEMRKLGIIHILSKFVYNSQTIQEIIDFFGEILENSRKTRSNVIVIILRRQTIPEMMN